MLVHVYKQSGDVRTLRMRAAISAAGNNWF
jgi:hypothetical protein